MGTYWDDDPRPRRVQQERPLRLTRRGWRVVVLLALVVGLLLGLTAHLWSPWAQDNAYVTRFEDGTTVTCEARALCDDALDA